MAIALDNVLKITQNQSYLGQLVQNVYFYSVIAVPTVPDGTDPYEYALQRFNATVGIKMRPLQSTALNHTIYRVDNLSNGIDFYELAINVPGGMAEEASPSYNALNFILRRSNLLTRNGSKRVGGIGEAASNGNTCIISPTVLQDYANAVAGGLLTADATPTVWATSVIVGRTLEVDSEGKETYVLDLTKINPIQSAGFTAMSTQRSRKAGHGI
jgi:hypothetical protein